MPPSPALDRPAWRTADAPRSLGRTLGGLRSGIGDPTTRLEPGRFRRAVHTPDGPATLLLRWSADPAPVADADIAADAWGPGAGWILARVDRLTGSADVPVELDGAHPVVARALRLRRDVRLTSSGDLYHQLLPTVVAQRVTAGEALRQWARLCHRLGDAAPGPARVTDGMRLPPSPASLHRRPAWWFHPLGIESKRARALTEIARHADKLWAWADAGAAVAAEQLALVPGVGPWTIGSVLGAALGDPDAVPVGDYHLPNTVAWALAREPRADDDRMLELLEPYRGQRGRVLAAIVSTSGPAPKFGPQQRILPMARW